MSTRCFIIGAGGITFHSLPALAVELHSRSCDSITVIDPDTFELRNNSRQAWGGREGQPKAELCASLLRSLLPHASVTPLVSLAQSLDWTSIPLQSHDLILCLPDNHACRAWVCDSLTPWLPLFVTVAFAGNELLHGQSYGFQTRPAAWYAPSAEGSQLLPNPHSIMPAVFAPDDPTPPVGHCADSPDQSTISNFHTAICLIKVLRFMRNSDWAAMCEWGTNPNDLDFIYHRFTCLPLE